MAFPITDIYPLTESYLSASGHELIGVHGSIHQGGYLWLTSRMCSNFGRVPVNDYNNYETLELITSSQFTDAITYASGCMWIPGVAGAGSYIYKVSTSFSSSYPISCYSSLYAPIVSDDEFLYTALVWMIKTRISTGEEVIKKLSGITNCNAHAMVEDGDYLYINAVDSEEAGGKFAKVKKSNLTVIDSVSIPQCTDDMTQDEEYCYLGVEIPSSSVYPGPGWDTGSLRIKKSDLSVYSVPKFESETLTSVSYFTGIFNGYLVDCKTNNHIYVMSLPDLTLVKDYYINDISSGYINEFLRDDEGYFHSTLWKNGGRDPSGLIKFSLPDLPVTTSTTHTAVANYITVTSMKLNGSIWDVGGSHIIEKGFYFGTSSPPSQKIVIGEDFDNYSSVVEDLDSDTLYYYQAYSENSIGENKGLIQSSSTLKESDNYKKITSLDYSYQGQPFCWVAATGSVLLTTMDYAYQAQPFVANKDEEAAASNIKSISGIAYASIKNVMYIPIASIKKICGVTN